MSFIYTRANLKTRFNAQIQGKSGLLISADDLCNEAMREVGTEIDLRSRRRKAVLTPNLFNGIFEYACPSDLQAYSIIDIPPQAAREDGEFEFVPSEQFLRNPRRGDISINDFNGVRVLLINSDVSDSEVSINPITSISANGQTWTAFGDATNVATDSDRYVKGSGSVEFSISAAGGTTAGIQTSDLDSIDLSEFILHVASVFTYARITDPTNITNYILHLGTDSSNYYEFTVTVRNDGTAFVAGQNLLRFDLASPSQTVLSPDANNINYAALYMTKDASKVTEADYAFNWLTAKKGKYYDVAYYSKFGWQTSAGAYIENSTDDSDLIVADTDEFDLIVKKARVLAAGEADLPDSQIKRLSDAYKLARTNYQAKSPSEVKTVISSYYNYN